jgi:dolichyl-phosphate-mannose--protein O-mannosyl transferase
MMTVQSKAKLITLSERLKNLLDTFLVFLLTLVAYASTMPQKITLEDAGLFQMVCNLEGISHPPGYPLFTLLCQQMTLTPTVVNGNLISALFASLALVVFYRIVLLLTTDRLTALIAAFSYGFSSTFWSQAIIIEVYSLAALLFMLAWWLALRFALVPSWPRWAWLCFAVGLGLSNHWPLMVLSCLGVVVVLTTRWQYLISALRSPLFWLLSLACVGAGLLPYFRWY